MKVLAVLLTAAVLVQAAKIQNNYNLSKYPPRSVLFPRPNVPRKPPSLPVNVKPIDLRAVCGQAEVSGRIIGGSEAVPHSAPWQLGMYIDEMYFCGASLISEDWVLTAAHCADFATSFRILFGAHDLRETNETYRTEAKSNEFIVHENWNSETMENDIALIRLPAPVTFNVAIKPICLELTGNVSHVGEYLHLTGWGRFSDSSPNVSPVLKATDVPCVDKSECDAVYDVESFSDKLICASTNETATCNGDSGGPLSFTQNAVTTQAGIVSFGASVGCEAGYPDGYTRVRSYAEWISNITGIVA